MASSVVCVKSSSVFLFQLKKFFFLLHKKNLGKMLTLVAQEAARRSPLRASLALRFGNYQNSARILTLSLPFEKRTRARDDGGGDFGRAPALPFGVSPRGEPRRAH
jgi:hypothetical protein